MRLLYLLSPIRLLSIQYLHGRHAMLEISWRGCEGRSWAGSGPSGSDKKRWIAGLRQSTQSWPKHASYISARRRYDFRLSAKSRISRSLKKGLRQRRDARSANIIAASRNTVIVIILAIDRLLETTKRDRADAREAGSPNNVKPSRNSLVACSVVGGGAVLDFLMGFDIRVSETLRKLPAVIAWEVGGRLTLPPSFIQF